MIRLRTLGTTRLESPDGEEAAAVLAQPKRFALLVYLTIAQPRGPRRRDTLLALFWPELDQSRARHALSQSLHFLRQRLGADVIVAGAEDVAVDPEQIGCDVHDFDRAIADGQLERALDLYQGDFLSGFHLADAAEFEQWADGERTRLRVAAIGAAHRCAERAISGDRALEGVTWASRALALDPTNERAIRRLMHARDAAGDRAGALRDYADFALRMRQELSAEPSPETQRLADQIRSRSEASAKSSADAWRHRRDQPTERAPEEDRGAPARTRRRLMLTAAAAVLASVGVASAAINYTGGGREQSIAVLPFTDLGADRTDAYLGDGLSEEVTRLLEKLPGLDVSVRTSAFRGRNLDVRAIAETLDVATVLEGTIRRDGDSVRIGVQLIDAGTGHDIWSEQYHRTVRDMFVVQHEIARSVARALRLVAGDSLIAAPAMTTNAAAYDAYLRGRHSLAGRTRASMLAAIAHFRRAVALDSTFARAYAGLGDAYTALADSLPPKDTRPGAP